MAAPRRVRLEAIGGLRADGENRWVAETGDPQFLLHGPFGAGLWELTFQAASPDGSPYAGAQIYFSPTGAFNEAQSIRFPAISPTLRDHRLTFWLPFDVPSLRFDPSDVPGRLVLGPVTARGLGRVAGVLKGVAAAWRQAPAGTSAALVRAARAVASDRAGAKRMIRAIAMPDSRPYPAWLARRVAARRTSSPQAARPGLFSIVTTAFDTRPDFLRDLAHSVRSQTCEDFEWVLLDNGSTSEATRRALADIGSDPRVKLFRVDGNLGIIGGMRFVLERATGEYILPVDSDDRLFEDTLATMADAVERTGRPPLLYSDEDKLRDGIAGDPFLKPDWDPVLLRNCCYIAHLTAIRRDLALHLGAYTDPRAEGCHDWDTFLRFVRAGHDAVHVPEILYSWRMHGGSTAENISSKDYIVSSQRHVLEKHVELSGRPRPSDVVRSPFFPHSPDWWIRRRREAAEPATLIVVAEGGDVGAVLSQLGGFPLSRVIVIGAADDRPGAGVGSFGISWAGDLHSALNDASASPGPFVAIATTAAMPAGDEWLWEMLALREAFPDAAVVGGRILDSAGRVASAGEIFGFGGSAGSPDRGRRADDAGYFGTALKQRSVSAVSALLCGIDPAFLRQVLESSPRGDVPASLDELGDWLGDHARARSRRVVFSPFIEATAARGPARAPRRAPRERDTRYYHALLSTDPATPFEPA